MTPALLAFLIGLLIGSFLNVCVYRLPRDLSVVRPRSYCPACEHPIAWYDNVPVASWLALGGKCRACGAAIPWRYPLVELATGAAFGGAVWGLGVTPAAAKLAVFSAILITLIASDLEERILPDEFTIGGTLAGIGFAYFVPLHGLVGLLLPTSWIMRLDLRWVSVLEAAFSAAVASGLIWVVGAAYEKLRHKEGLGFGDVKMLAMMGSFLGLQGALLALLGGSLSGAVLGLAYIRWKGEDPDTYELPFGSFLGLASLAVAVGGTFLWDWYARGSG
jgi:leader peptidase (prepilin peptidase)/N-methyltransferase